MSLTIRKEGVNQLKVLSAFVTLEKEGEPLRQRNVVEITTLTKGAVSNNCKKLAEDGLLENQDNTYSIDEERLLELYRNHFENYFRRRNIPPKFQHYNEIRTATKKQFDKMIRDETGTFLKNILKRVLASADEENQINTIRDVFHRVDELVEKIAEDAYQKENNSSLRRDLMMMAVVMDRSPEHQSFLEDYSLDLTNTLTFEMAKDLEEVIEDA